MSRHDPVQQPSDTLLGSSQQLPGGFPPNSQFLSDHRARDATAGISQNAKVMRDKDGAFTGGRRRGRCETTVKWGSLKRKMLSQWDGIRPEAQLSLTGDNLVSILCPDDVIS